MGVKALPRAASPSSLPGGSQTASLCLSRSGERALVAPGCECPWKGRWSEEQGMRESGGEVWGLTCEPSQGCVV